MAEAAPLPVDVLGRPYAAWWRRVVALVIDSLVVGIPARILTIVLIGIPTQGQTEGAASYQARLVSRALPFTILVGLLYYGLLNGGLRGQTLGKRALGIQVRDAATGDPIGVGRGMIRYVVVAVFSIFFGIPELIDGLVPLWDARRQSWHDKAVNSVVVEVPRGARPLSP